MLRRHVNLRRTLPALALLSIACIPAVGDGCFFPKADLDRRSYSRAPAAPGQKAIIIRDDASHEILLLETTYHGPSTDFAWVVPVPGRPRHGDVFLANPHVLDQVEWRTRSSTRTIVVDPFTGLEATYSNPEREAMEQTMGPLGGRASEAVSRIIVYERMPVGNYDVSILSATGRGVLVDWLRRNGYAFPRHAETIVDDYVARGWTFVALRVRPLVQRSQAMLKDVAPIGIRFPTKVLVYPLAISRVSASNVTNLLLFVLDKGGVSCAELPVVTFPAELKGKRGDTYYTLARGLLAHYAGQALLCEARKRFTTAVPDELKVMNVRKNGKKIMLLGPLMVTRLWGQLPKQAMRDITFKSSGDSSVLLSVRKIANLLTPGWMYLFGTGNARCIWTALGFLVVVIALWPREVPRSNDEASAQIRRVCWCALPILIALAALMFVPATKSPIGYGPSHWPPDEMATLPLRMTSKTMASARVLLSLWVVPASLLIGSLVRKLPHMALRHAIPWFAIMMAVALMLKPVTIANEPTRIDLGAWGTLFKVLSFVGLVMVVCPFAVAIAWTAIVEKRRISIVNALTLAVFSLMILVPLVGWLCERVTRSRPTVFEVAITQNDALTDLERALKIFRDATGAYPKQLTDLTSPHLPTKGLDVSGNEVELAGSPPMPMLPELPVDPLTGRNDTWVYDPRSPNLVESGAFEVTVTMELQRSGSWTSWQRSSGRR